MQCAPIPNGPLDRTPICRRVIVFTNRLFAVGPAMVWGGRLCTNAKGSSFRIVDLKRIGVSHEITQLAKSERSWVKVGRNISELFSDCAKRYPAILTLDLFDNFIQDRRRIGKRPKWFGGAGRVRRRCRGSAKKILRVHEAATSL